MAESSKKKHDDFMKKYSLWLGAQDVSEAMASKDVNVRERARLYVLKHAIENVPGLDVLAEDATETAKFLSSQAAVDKVLADAQAHYGAEAVNRFKADSHAIIENAPNEGLAAIVLDRLELAKHPSKQHKRAAEAHENYIVVDKVLAEKGNHERLYRILIPTIMERVKKRLSENEYLKDDEELINATVSAASFVMAGSETLTRRGGESLRDSYRMEFAEQLPTAADGAGYAREVLKELASDDRTRPFAMTAVYETRDAAAQVAAVRAQRAA